MTQARRGAGGGRGDSGEPDIVSFVAVLPLRNLVFFPHTEGLLPVGRPRSMRAIEEATGALHEVILVAERAVAGSSGAKEPRPEDLYGVGTLAKVLTVNRVSARMVEVQVVGLERARIVQIIDAGDHFQAEAKTIEEPIIPPGEIERVHGLVSDTKRLLDELERLRVIANEYRDIEDPSELADKLASILRLGVAEKQAVLEEVDAAARLAMVQGYIAANLERARGIAGRGGRGRTRGGERGLALRRPPASGAPGDGSEGEGEPSAEERDEFKSELDELEARIEAKPLSREAKSRARKEIKKLRLMAPMSAEATVVRNYLDWILVLPWNELTADKTDLAFAEKVLDDDHYGLKNVKERILEYLAVKTLAKGGRAPILCFVGPPGVGKTSLAKSIARATGKRFVRQSLGGVRDEAEIRGHRRTYIGALPGRILQSLRKAGSNNPVFLLDEVDKLSSDYRGDPASALLEALDPEQNVAFNDHYLDLDYDLSKVMFITTANTLVGIPPALQDRMEVIRLPGYADEEKFEIATRFLFKKQREACGLADVNVEFAPGAFRELIARYTREAGVRNLEREIGSICRKIAKQVVAKDAPKRFVVTASVVRRYLGPPRYRVERGETRDQVGVAMGLAWTEVGGEILTIEVSVMPGKGKLIVTGKLGDVMKESAQAAMSYVRSRAHVFQWTKDFYQRVDVHIHVPEGATPKDGPSAGITMATALVSAFAKLPVRHDVAMTGEITLRGRVLPVGGIKEKLLAAHRSGITKIVMGRENEKDVAEIPKRIMKALNVVYVDHMDEVLKEALAVGGRGELLRLAEPQAAQAETETLEPASH